MRSIHGSLEQLQALIDVSIARFDNAGDRQTYRALIDTGATRTCITPKIVRRFDLPPVMKLLVAGANSHPERRNAFEFSLGLHHAVADGGGFRQSLYVIDHPFVAPDFRDNENFDVLHGMDVLSQGRLVIDRNEFRFEFAF